MPFGIQSGRAALVLAPMEGVTDAPMRAFLGERQGFSFCVSEFLRISQDVPPGRVFLDHVPELKNGSCTPDGTPVQVQLLGGDAEKLARAAQIAAQLGAVGVDLNFGCPAPTVNRHDGGATLLKYPQRIREIVGAVRAAVPAAIPISAKIRLGWDSFDGVVENAQMAAEGGASWITIHGRTRMQGYKPPAYWGPIGEVRRALSIPVVANGEIWSLDDFRRCRDETGCEHFMLGRGALADPCLVWAIAGELGIRRGIERNVERVSQGEELRHWVPLMRRYLEVCRQFTDPADRGYAVARIKQWVRMARVRLPLPWFDTLKTLQTLPEVEAWLLANT